MNIEIRTISDRATFEAMIANIGGAGLSDLEATRRRALRELQGSLPEGAQPRLVAYSDALTDTHTARAEHAAQAGLLLGVGVGAALQAFPDEQPEAVAEVAGQAVALLLASPMAPPAASNIAQVVLGALARVGARWTGDAGTPPVQGDGLE